MTIEDAVLNIKGFISNPDLTGQIRSGKIIDEVHEAVKYKIRDTLSRNNITNPNILPPIGEHKKGELQLAGFLKRKTQDICITPNFPHFKEYLGGIALNAEEDEYGSLFTKWTLSINVRSQMSKITANTDTLFERTYAEALNLHLRCPDMVLGEVYMLSLYDINSKKYLSKKIIEKYIKFFKSITKRYHDCTTYYQYEATCLLLVDFSQSTPKIYHSTQELINDGFLDEKTNVKYKGLEWNSFFEKIVKRYDGRFGLSKLQH